ncbi:MAG: hypothetical protein R3301_06875 [Saprospiraceae bacterium]|nr:hypothetical protein [Saprospiraceae bacterium]
MEKAKRILKKVQALVDNMDEQGTASSLERDLLRSYLRDLYEAVSQPVEDTAPRPKSKAAEPMEVQHVEAVPVTTQEEPSPAAEAEVPEPPAADPEPIQQPEPEPELASVTHPAVVDEMPQRDAPVAATKASTTVRERPAALLDLFEVRASAEVADNLQSQPITAIQDEMGINERLLTINELFGGNPQAFDEAVRHLNGLNDFVEAREYLLDGPAQEYVWADEERAKKARVFVQLVRRKYL